MPRFSLMFHSGSNCALKVKIFVLNVESITDVHPVISKCRRWDDVSLYFEVFEVKMTLMTEKNAKYKVDTYSKSLLHSILTEPLILTIQ